MKFRSLITFLFIFSLATSFVSSNNSKVQKRMFTELDFIKNVFEVKYAPLEWKKSFAGFDLDKTFDRAKKRVNSETSTKQFQQILRDAFNASCDYHVGVSFYSTESASLPFLVQGAEGRYFLSYIDRGQLPRSFFSYQVGDEIVEFDNQPIDQVIQNIRLEELGSGNTLETDQALSEKILTNRIGERGHTVPSGPVQVKFKRKKNDYLETVNLEWDYVPEHVKETTSLNQTTKSAVIFSDWKKNPKRCLYQSDLFQKMMVYPQWKRSYVGGSLDLDNRHQLGSRKSYIPALGKKIWQTSKEDVFDAYIFQSPSGHNVGYIRIASYLGDEPEAVEFCKWIKFLEENSDALVIDQINNPGGSLFYLYSLAAALTDYPLATPKHRITLTQDEIYMAVSYLPSLDDVKTESEAKEAIGNTLGGYPVTMETVDLMRGFFRFLIKEWNEGKLYTDPTYLFGVDEIQPHPDGHYTKPILLLTNSLDFSGGDFFPAIMQDNKRVTILGERTAGAGGYVMETWYPNQNGVAEFHLTASLAQRVDQNPIENLGVIPDILYSLTINDMEHNYQEYVDEILKTVESILPISDTSCNETAII